MTRKRRPSASVDMDRREHERRLAALAELIREYEAEFGEITGQEIDAASRWACEHAIVVRPSIDRR